MSAKKPAAVGDIWHRVDAEWIDNGHECYEGMELIWTTWRCTKTTPAGARFVCTEWRARPNRFALTSGARNLHRTDREALEALVARKRRQVAILESQERAAKDALAVARACLSAMRAAT